MTDRSSYMRLGILKLFFFFLSLKSFDVCDGYICISFMYFIIQITTSYGTVKFIFQLMNLKEAFFFFFTISKKLSKVNLLDL